MKIAPVDPVTLQVDLEWVRANIDANTVALIGSAPNYGYGTVDPITELGALALERGIGLHVDGCLGDSSSLRRELGYDIPAFRFLRCPASRPSQRTRISTATH